MKFLFNLIPILLFPLLALSQNEAPYIDYFEVYNDPASQTALLNFTLNDAENDLVEVKVFNLQANGKWIELSGEGAIGPDITPDGGKEIYLNQNYYLGPDGNEANRIKILVNDHQGFDISSIIEEVDPDRVYNHIDYLQGIRHRNTGPDHLEDARMYIEDKFVNATDEFKKETFDYFGYDGENLIGEKTGIGNQDEILIIDAHYDSVDNAPGADDNASGVAGVLECLEILKTMTFEKSIQFISFDLEEAGLKGSIDYVTKANTENAAIIGVLNFEMIGYYTEEPNTQDLPAGFQILFPDVYKDLVQDEFRGNFIANVGAGDNPGLMKCYDSLAQLYVPELRVISLESPGNGSIVPDLTRSDHAPFWLSGYPAVMLSDAAEFRNKNYHTPKDSIQYLDMDFAANVVKATIATAIEKAIPVNGGAYFPNEVIILDTENIDPCSNIHIYQIGKQLLISDKDCIPADYQWSLYNKAGQLIRESALPLEQNTFNALKEGIYILRFRANHFDQSVRFLFING
jgi:hypothetical protein